MSHAGAEKVSSLYEVIRQKDNELVHMKAEGEREMREYKGERDERCRTLMK